MIEKDRTQTRAVDFTRKTWTGGFHKLHERRVIRVLVPYSRTLYFNDSGRGRAITPDFVRAFER